MIALPPPASAKLAKVVGLLGSDQPGEVLNAAAAATRILRQHGATWADLLRPGPTPQARQAEDHRARARRVLMRGGARLSAWEREFLESLTRRAAKQAAALDRVEAAHV